MSFNFVVCLLLLMYDLNQFSSIVICKLFMYGIRGIELNWFKSYMRRRRQTTKLNDIESDEIINNFGVPQCFILGTLLQEFQLIIKNIKIWICPKLIVLIALTIKLRTQENSWLLEFTTEVLATMCVYVHTYVRIFYNMNTLPLIWLKVCFKGYAE